MHLDGLPNGPLGLLNVYGPNNLAECIKLWRTILQTINHSRPWLLEGDWNFGEKASNQIGGVLEDLAGEELIVWDTLKATLGLSDVYHPAETFLHILGITIVSHRNPLQFRFES